MAQASPQTRSRRPDIQGLRAVAVLLIVAFHAGLPLPGGFVGVDVFFVISGYVVTLSLLRMLDGGPDRFLRTFYARRARRLMPALAVMTTVVLVLAVLLQTPFGPQQTTAKTGLAATFLVANLAVFRQSTGYFSIAAEQNPLLHTWSLSVEEQIYLVFPAVVLVCFVLARSRGIAYRSLLLPAVLILTAGSFAISVVLSGALPGIGLPTASAFAFFSSLTRAWEFGAGVVVALLVVRHGTVLPRTLGAVAGAAGLVLVGLAAVTIDGKSGYPGFAALVPVVGCALVVLAGAGHAGAIQRGLAAPTLVGIGNLSYSWYLWHWPVIVFTRLLWPSAGLVIVTAAAAASIGPAWLSTRYVENPLRRPASRSGTPTWVIVAVGVTVPAVVAVAVFAGANASWRSPSVASMSQQISRVPMAIAAGCVSGAPVASGQPAPCTWSTSRPGPHLYLVGDSNAGQFGEGLLAASQTVGGTLTISSMNFCPFIDLTMMSEGSARTSCRSFVGRTRDWLQAQPPGIVVIGNAADVYLSDTDGSFSEDGKVDVGREPRARETAWNRGLERMTTVLTAAGHRVVIVQPVPHFGESAESMFPPWQPQLCPNRALYESTRSCGRSLPRSLVAERQRSARAVHDRLAMRTGVTSLDLVNSLCDPKQCGTSRGSNWLYRDGGHISAGTSESLGPVFVQAICAIPGLNATCPPAPRSAAALSARQR